MQDLIKQEQFELEVLDKLNSKRFLSRLVLGGGTMLRLCFGLSRFSVDLDFWLTRQTDTRKLFTDLKAYFSGEYVLTDCANKFYTLLFEIKSKDYPRRLKIEIRKERQKIKTEQAIAYSRYSNAQVFLKTVSLDDMVKGKISAFLERKEIRDVFDLEFLLKKGIVLNCAADIAKKLLKEIDCLDKKDYTVKLGSLLDPGQRKYYLSENFKILKIALKERL